jgi:hypothetical protein
LNVPAARSPIDRIAGHLDSKIGARREEMFALGNNLSELKSHDLVQLDERQAMLSAEVYRRLDDLERHLAASVPRGVYEKGFSAHETAMHAAYRDYARAVEAALAQGKAAVAAFDAQEKAVTSAMEAVERAVGKSETAAESHLEAANEFRAQLSDQASTFLPRAEFDRLTSAITDKIEASNERLIDLLDDLETYGDTTAGKSTGINAGWAALIGLATLVGTVLILMIATFFFRK